MKNNAGYTATEIAFGWAGPFIKHANSSIRGGAAKDAQNAKTD